MAAIRKSIIVGLLVALSALATHATIDVYPYAEGTTLLDVQNAPYIPTSGADLKGDVHNCGTLVTTLVNKFRTDKFSIVITDLRNKYLEKQAVLDKVEKDNTAFANYLRDYYPVDKSTPSIDVFKLAYQKDGSFQKTQYGKQDANGKIRMAVHWAMKKAENPLVLPFNDELNGGKKPGQPGYTYPAYPFTVSAEEVEAAKRAKALYEKKLDSVSKAFESLKTGSVLGVALVDLGTSVKPNIQAYFAPSGSGSNLSDGEVENINSLLPLVDDANKYPNWKIFTSRNLDLDWKSKFVPSTRRVKVKNEWVNEPVAAEDDILVDNVNFPPVDIIKQSVKWLDWKKTAFPDANTVFALQAATESTSVGPTLNKKWKVSDGSQGGGLKVVTDQATLVGTCALQKLVYGLFGQDREEFGPAKRLYKGAQLPTVAVAPKLICAAEAVNGDDIKVNKKDGERATYSVGSQVPSCVACQAVLPHLMSRPKPELRFRQLAKLKEMTTPRESLQPHTH